MITFRQTEICRSNSTLYSTALHEEHLLQTPSGILRFWVDFAFGRIFSIQLIILFWPIATNINQLFTGKTLVKG